MVIVNVPGMITQKNNAIKLMAKANSYLQFAKSELNSKKDSRYTAMCEVQISLTKGMNILKTLHKG